MKKGSKSFPILVPLLKKVKEKDPQTGEEEERSFLYGFTSAAVFGIEQTEGPVRILKSHCEFDEGYDTRRASRGEHGFAGHPESGAIGRRTGLTDLGTLLTRTLHRAVETKQEQGK